MPEWLVQAWERIATDGDWAGVAVAVVVALGSGGFALWRLRRKSTGNPPNSTVSVNKLNQSGGQSQRTEQVGGDMIGGDFVSRDRTTNVGANADAIVDKLMAKSEEAGRLRSERDEARAERDTLRGELRDAVQALQEQRAVAEPVEADRIGAALAMLKQGNTVAAEAEFHAVLDAKSTEGQAANKEAARAAQHLGALAFLHDTQKAIAAFERSVELDPNHSDGWIWLGNLRHRVGQLELAQTAYERALALGNDSSDKLAISVATGNLGLKFKARGNYKTAVEMFQQALERDMQLGNEMGVARHYGNLCSLYIELEDL